MAPSTIRIQQASNPLLRSDSGTYYYVTSPAVNNISEAVDALYPLVDKNFPISGNPWVYVKGK